MLYWWVYRLLKQNSNLCICQTLDPTKFERYYLFPVYLHFPFRNSCYLWISEKTTRMKGLKEAAVQLVIYCFVLFECRAVSTTRDPTSYPSAEPSSSPSALTSSPPSQTSRFCSVCLPGEFYNTKLAAGSANSVVGCTSCFPGYTCEGGCSDPVACDPGTFSSQYSASTCTECSPGSYNVLSAATSCKTCPAGYGCNSTVAGEEHSRRIMKQIVLYGIALNC